MDNESTLELRFWYTKDGRRLAVLYGPIALNRILKLEIYEFSLHWLEYSATTPMKYVETDIEFDSREWLDQIYRHEFRYNLFKESIMADHIQKILALRTC